MAKNRATTAYPVTAARPRQGPIIAHGSAKVASGGRIRWIANPPAGVKYISHQPSGGGQR
jgi:hypothetical protein